MAISPKNLYPSRIIDGDAGFPYGKALDIQNGVVGTGTPLRATWLNDIFGFQQSLLSEANITPNGTPDEVGSSQYLDAVKHVARQPLNLKVFQSPTDGLTQISTRTANAGEVYEVRKVSDDSLATIYIDKGGLNPITQNGTSNVSGSDGVVEFFVADGDYYVEVNGVKSGLLASRLEPFLTVEAMTAASYLTKYVEGTRVEWQGYYEQSDGGSNWGVLKFGAHTEDGGSIFSIDANTYVEANLKGGTSLAKFGAMGNGDETLKIQAALNATDRVYGVRGVMYLFSTLLIPASVSVFNGRRAIFKPLGTTNPANIETEAAIKCFGNEGLELNVELDMSNGDMQAVLWDNVKNSQFTKSKIYGFVDNPTFNHRGIRLQNECKNNEIHKNYIEGVNTPTQRGLLIDVWGVPAADFGGFFTGTIAFPVSTSSCNNIHHNRLINGSYAVNLQAANENSFHHNYCVNQDHRGIYVANASRDNMIHHNIVKDFLSSGILLGYGSSFNDVSFNRFIRASFSGGGEATINIITGSSDNNIYCNYSDSNNNYGCYISTDSSRNKVRQNEFKRFYVAGVAVENDFSETRPTNCFYSRPNYGSPTELNPAYQSWTYNDLEGTIIEGNIFGAGDTGRQVACIAVSQIQNSDATITGNITAIRGVTIKNNLFTSSENIAPYLSFYEQLNDRLTDITVTDNDFPAEALTSDFYYFKPSGAQDFNDLKVVKRYGNDRFDDIYNNLSNNVAGSVINVSKYNIDTSDKFISLVNTVATNVTDFTIAKTNTTLTIRLDAFSTIKHDNAKIRLVGSVDVTPQNSNSFITLRRVSGIWIEVSRSF